MLLVSPAPEGDGVRNRPGVETFDVKQELIALFDDYAAETYRLLGISFCVLAALLALLFRRNFLRYLLPTAAALVAERNLADAGAVPVADLRTRLVAQDCIVS